MLSQHRNTFMFVPNYVVHMLYDVECTKFQRIDDRVSPATKIPKFWAQTCLFAKDPGLEDNKTWVLFQMLNI